MSLLSVEDLDVRHGLLQAVRGVSLHIDTGETLALVGANGAGKSTLLRAIAGAPPRPSAGRIVLDGEDVTALRPHIRVGKGIALVPEGRQLFVSLTVEENLLVAARRTGSGSWTVDSVLEAFPLLRERRHHRAGTLSGGERQATAIGRALMTNPRVLLLDEVSLGLAPVAVEDVYRSLTTVIESGTAVVLVEQDLTRALATAGRVLCMLEGRIVLEGSSSELTREQVTDAYFGLQRDGGGGQGGARVTWVNAVIQGILLGGLYALFACGLSLLYGVMKIINLAHGDLALLGAFGVVVVLDHSGLSAFGAMVLVIPAAAALGWILDRLIFERSLRGGELSPLLATFGLSIVIGNLLLELFSSDSHSFSAGALETSAWHINSEISIAALPALIFVVAVAVLGGLQLFLSRARMGREMRATADDPVTAELVGIDARRIYATAAAISIATAALAGIFNGMRSSFDPAQGSSLLIYGFEAVIIGGLGSLWGTLIGGIVLGVAQTVAAQHNPSWAILAGDFVFLAVLAFRQQGILGAREARA